MKGLWEFLKNLLSVLAYFFDPKERKRRQKEKTLKQIEILETEYGKALAEGDAQRASEVAAEMGISRQRVKQIENAALEKLRNNQKVRVLYEGIIDGCDGARTYSNHLDYYRVRDSRAR